MKKVCNKWKVFLIVLCMLFTMFPSAVMAEEPVIPPAVEADLTPPAEPPATEQQAEAPDGTPPAEPPVVEPDATPPAIKSDDPAKPDDLTDGTSDEPQEDLQMLPFLMQSKCLLTQLVLSYKCDNNSGGTDLIRIASVIYDDNNFGVRFNKNPKTIVIVDCDFPADEITFKYDARNYVPDKIIDTDGVTWVLDDKGDGQQKNFKITKGETSYGEFHYKKCTTGNLTIIKKIRNNVTIPDTNFTFNISKWISGPDGHYEYVKSVTINGAGSTDPIALAKGNYKIEEVGVQNFLPVNYQKLNINIGDNRKLTFVNTYTGPPAPTTGGITITKAIVGDPENASTFTFTIEGTRYSNSVSITGEGSETINNLVPGTYTITESDVAHYTPDSVSKQAIVVAGKTEEVTFTNTYSNGQTTPTPGSITIHKVIYKDNEQKYTDPDPDNPPVFTFTVSLSDENLPNVRLADDNSYTVKITGAGIATIEDLDPGEYTITEVNYPENYRPLENNLPVTLDAGENEQVYFTNVYTEPGNEPSVRVYKTVAEYDGSNIPNDITFVKQLNLSVLNKQVLYKIDLTCDREMEYTTVRLEDLYNSLNITDKLLVLDNGSLVEANTVYDDDEFPNNIGVNYESFTTFYYIDTLAANGTYTNTAYLYEPYGDTPTRKSEAPGALASSSAVVVINYQSGGGNLTGGGGGSSHHNYQVVYHANYPVTTSTSGTVPADNNNYSYNSKVSVRGNTGDLKVDSYNFAGWNTKSDGTGTAYQSGDTFSIKSDVDLYAQWKTADETAQVDTNTDDTGNAAALSDNNLDDIPKTGDATPLMPMLLLGMLSLAGIALSVRKKSGEAEV